MVGRIVFASVISLGGLALAAACTADADAIGGPVADASHPEPDVFDDAPPPDAGTSTPDGTVGTDGSGPDAAVDAGYCSACQTLATGFIRDFVLDDTSIYWTNLVGVEKVLLDGGSLTALATGQPNTVSLAVDSSRVYWTTDSPGTVASAPLDGGAATTLATGLGMYGIAVDEARVYYVSLTAGGGLLDIMSLPLDGGTPTPLTPTGTKYTIVTQLFVDATSVYWSALDTGNVMSVPVGGGTPTTIASGQSYPELFAVDAHNVYWADNDPDGGTFSVMSAPIDGGAAQMIAALSGSQGGMARDSTNYYWTDINAGTVMSLPADGGVPTLLAAGQGNPGEIVATSTNLYWANDTAGTYLLETLAPK